MAFIAGVVKFSNFQADMKKRFEESIQLFEKNLNWPLERIETDEYILVHSSTLDFWEGPKMIEGSNYDAIATGVQWKQIPSSKSTLDYLTTHFLKGKHEFGNYFDYFSCVIIDKKRKKCVLITDPL
ncbi:unnamed protein product, partial [marine sediment metagenome]